MLQVETINSRPVLYKVIRYYERFDKPSPEEEISQDSIME
ncbi:hypothetical protein BH20ACI3_BH20ACI3_24690 [soil metagenome]